MSEQPQAVPGIVAMEVAPRTKPSFYPPLFAQRVAGRVKRQLGDHFGLRNFGVNLTVMQPGAISALHHRHTTQDEFIYVVEGEITLHLGNETQLLTAGMCAGFPAGGAAHHLENRSNSPARYLEIGDRSPDDVVSYPDDDLVALRQDDGWVFTHRDGTPY